MSHNELVDQLQTLKCELQDLDNDHEKQTDDLLQTQAHLDQAQKQVQALKAENAAEITRRQALKNDTERPELSSRRLNSPVNFNDTLES